MLFSYKHYFISVSAMIWRKHRYPVWTTCASASPTQTNTTTQATGITVFWDTCACYSPYFWRLRSGYTARSTRQKTAVGTGETIMLRPFSANNAMTSLSATPSKVYWTITIQQTGPAGGFRDWWRFNGLELLAGNTYVWPLHAHAKTGTNIHEQFVILWFEWFWYHCQACVKNVKLPSVECLQTDRTADPICVFPIEIHLLPCSLRYQCLVSANIFALLIWIRHSMITTFWTLEKHWGCLSLREQQLTTKQKSNIQVCFWTSYNWGSDAGSKRKTRK